MANNAPWIVIQKGVSIFLFSTRQRTLGPKIIAFWRRPILNIIYSIKVDIETGSEK